MVSEKSCLDFLWVLEQIKPETFLGAKNDNIEAVLLLDHGDNRENTIVSRESEPT